MDNTFIYCNFTFSPVTWSMLGRKNLPMNAHPISVLMLLSQVGRQNEGSYVCFGKYNSTKKFKARSLLLVLFKLIDYILSSCCSCALTCLMHLIILTSSFRTFQLYKEFSV